MLSAAETFFWKSSSGRCTSTYYTQPRAMVRLALLNLVLWFDFLSLIHVLWFDFLSLIHVLWFDFLSLIHVLWFDFLSLIHVLQLTNRSSPTAAHQPQLTNRSSPTAA